MMRPRDRQQGDRDTRGPASVRRTGVLCVTLLGAAAVVAGCAKSGHDQSVSATRAADAQVTSSASSDAVSPAGTSRCHTGGLKVTTRSLGAAAGHHYAALEFTNTSGSTCRVYGFPGMQLLSVHGHKIATKVVRDPSATPKLVTLKAGATAWARTDWGAVPASGEPQTGSCESAAESTEVTPPDETAHRTVRWSYGPVCQRGRIVVTALAAGHGPTAN